MTASQEEPTVQAGDRAEIEINTIAYGGDGVGRLDNGMAVFVPYTLTGETVKIVVTEVHKRFARGKALEILTPAANRVEPQCPYYGECGGCQYQHLDDKDELAMKASQLKDLMTRVGKLENLPEIETPEVDTKMWNYRNRITMHPAKSSHEMGFVMNDNKTVIPTKCCPIASEPINKVMNRKDPQAEGGNVLMRCDAAGEVHICVGKKKSTRLIKERLAEREVLVPEQGFYQVHPQMLKKLIDWLKGVMSEEQHKLLIDAYCGVGVFSLALAECFERSVGIETYRPSIPIARQNAENWGIETAEFIAGPVETLLNRKLLKKDCREACILLDPPRSGCDREVLSILMRRKPGWVVYVACDPAVLARDLKRLCGKGEYSVERIACFNMFPQTAHFETVAILKSVRPPSKEKADPSLSTTAP